MHISNMKNEYKIISVNSVNDDAIRGADKWIFAFVYSNKGNFILKGFMSDITEFMHLLVSVGYKFFANIVTFNKASEIVTFSMNNWIFYKRNIKVIYVKKRVLIKNNKKFFKRSSWKIVNTDTNYLLCNFKRLPKKWIPEFENL